MRTITKNVYQFDELSDNAKEKARQWFREGLEFDPDFVLDDAATIAGILGIELDTRKVQLMNGSFRYDPEIFYSGFASQGDGASFGCRYEYKKGSCKAIRSHAPQDEKLHKIADDLRDIQKRYFYKLRARVCQSGRYVHEQSMRLEWCEDAEGNNRDYVGDEILEVLKDFAIWIYRQLEQEWEYMNSDDSVNENIRANEYEFDEEGSKA